MKTYGKYSLIIFSSIVLALNILFLLLVGKYSILNLYTGLLLLMIIGLTRIIVIAESEIKSYTFLWFLNRHRSINFDEFNKVNIYINGMSTFIFMKDDEKVATWYSNIYKFEAKKIELELQRRGIETWRSGPDAWGYFD